MGAAIVVSHTIRFRTTVRLLVSFISWAVLAMGCNSSEPLTCPDTRTVLPPHPLKAGGVLIKTYVDHDASRGNAWIAVGWLYRSDREYSQGAGHAGLAAGLVRSGFSFIELEAPPAAAGKTREFLQLGGTTTEKYLKLFLTDRDDPACATFNAWLSKTDWVQAQQTSEALAPRPGACIGSQPEMAPTARYAYVIKDLPADRGFFSYAYAEPPASWEIVDISSPKPVVIAALVRQAKRNAFSCPPMNVRNQFWDSVTPAADTTRK